MDYKLYLDMDTASETLIIQLETYVNENAGFADQFKIQPSSITYDGKHFMFSK